MSTTTNTFNDNQNVQNAKPFDNTTGQTGSYGGVGERGTNDFESNRTGDVMPGQTTNNSNISRNDDGEINAAGLGGNGYNGAAAANTNCNNQYSNSSTRTGNEPTAEERAALHLRDHGDNIPVTGSGGNYAFNPAEPVRNIDPAENYDSSVPPPKEAGFPTGKPSMGQKIAGSVMIAKAKVGAIDDQEKIHQGTMLKETGKKFNPEEEARREGHQAAQV